MTHIETWELRARFARALSAMYGAEVPAYTTLVRVSAEVNRDYIAAHHGAERLGSPERVTAERHAAIRVGTASELADAADLFAAFGMYPVGFYDLREADPPVPVVSTAFRPIDANELARNPFRVFTSMLAGADNRFFGADLSRRVNRFLNERALFDPALIAAARRIAADGGATADRAERFVDAAAAAFALSRDPIDKSWYDELARVSAVAADIAGLRSTHVNHLTPRVLDIDELYRRLSARGIAMIDAIQGPPRWDGPDVLLRQTSFRALAEPRLFRAAGGSLSHGALRVRFGEVEARGVALTPKGRERYDEAMAAVDGAMSAVDGAISAVDGAGAAVDGAISAEDGTATGLEWQEAAESVWPRYFPASDAELAADGLAYYRHGDPTQPIVYEDFLPRSAAGIFRSNLDPHAAAGDETGDEAGDEAGATTYGLGWMAGAIGHHIHDPYALYEKAAQ